MTANLNLMTKHLSPILLLTPTASQTSAKKFGSERVKGIFLHLKGVPHHF